VFEPRITNPREVSADHVRAILDRGARPTIQFSGPGATPGLLASINRLCIEFGDRLEVRFYGYYESPFDARVLEYLPDVRWLSVDCLTSISDEEHLARLPKLTKLAFGVFRYDEPEFLGRLPLEQLIELWVNETERRNLNLVHLSRCERLRTLSIGGHTKGIDAIASLPCLEQLHLNSIPKRQSLDFVGRCAPLRSLDLLLGGRPSLDDCSHPDLEKLTVIRVRGLESLGTLRRFPKLRSLHVEDQLQLRAIELDRAPLEELTIGNCKNLERISGLDGMTALRHLRVYRTKLGLDTLVEREWPPSMDILALYGSSERWNALARARLDQRGYREFSSDVRQLH
jgi:hypothetical protein